MLTWICEEFLLAFQCSSAQQVPSGKAATSPDGNEALFYSQGNLNPPISLVHLSRNAKLYKETEGGAPLL